MMFYRAFIFEVNKDLFNTKLKISNNTKEIIKTMKKKIQINNKLYQPLMLMEF